MNENVIYSINGPVVTVKDTDAFSMLEMVYVGNARLIGEVISIKKEFTTIQVYETTTGLKPGEPVYPTGQPISVTLGPGILRNIFDGIERPLEEIAKESGSFIPTGSHVDPLDKNKLWDVTVVAKVGDQVQGGDVYATIPETDLIMHKCMVSPYTKGKVIEVAPSGQYKIDDVVMKIEDEEGKIIECTLTQKWPIKQSRPVAKRLPISMPLITGQRVIDTLFPIAKGGTAAIPGGFGTGKTMTQHQLAKWCDADIIVYVGCGERGNEMTHVLEEFRELIDPKSNKHLQKKNELIQTLLICQLQLVKLLFILELHWLNITVIWVTMLRLWLTQLLVGQKHYVKSLDVWKKCLLKKGSLHTCLHVYLNSMNVLDI